MDVIAHFVKIEKFNIFTDIGTGEGSVSLQPLKETYEKNAKVTITAEQVSGFEFDHWSGSITGSSRVKTVTVSSDMDVVAHFAVTEEEGVFEKEEGVPQIGVVVGIIVAIMIGIAIGKKT